MTLIPALVRQRQADLCEFKASLVYRVSSRTGKATQRNPVLKKKKKNFKFYSVCVCVCVCVCARECMCVHVYVLRLEADTRSHHFSIFSLYFEARSLT